LAIDGVSNQLHALVPLQPKEKGCLYPLNRRVGGH